MPKIDAAKLSAVKNLLIKNKIDGYIISDAVDIQYFVGNIFYQGEAILLLHKRGVYLTARSLYQAPVSAAWPQITVEGCDSQRHLKILQTIKKLGLKAVGFDDSKEAYSPGVAYAAAGCKEVPGLVSTLRMAKTEREIKTMRAAAKIVYKSYAQLQKYIKPGITERQLARRLEGIMFDNGAEGISFETIAAFGPATADPHYKTGNTKLTQNIPVMLDFGCIYKGYRSDITRTFWFGGKPAPEFQKIYKTVYGAYQKAAKNARPGMSGAQIDALARAHIEAAGYGQYFTHRLGHGLGLEGHEPADLSAQNSAKIAPGCCFSIEPGIYLPGKFGARYEDCFYMAKTGPKILK